MKDRDLVILSIYDSGYGCSFMENGIVKEIDEDEKREAFKLRFKTYPENISLEELRKHYPDGTTVIICTDGAIYK